MASLLLARRPVVAAAAAAAAATVAVVAATSSSPSAPEFPSPRRGSTSASRSAASASSSAAVAAAAVAATRAAQVLALQPGRRVAWATTEGEAVAGVASGSVVSDSDVSAQAAEAAAAKKEALLREALKESHDALRAAGDAPVWRICLTGGPCGGKSTALHHLQERLTALGFRVFVVPESATIVITGGGMYKDYSQFTPDQSLAFEGSLMKTKMALEDAFVAIARASHEPSVIICDRGTMDTKAYLPNQSFDVLMDEYGWQTIDMRDRRYDAVIHLVSAAIGAEQYYTTENNAARTETPTEAAALDFKILNAWIGHPQMRIIDNSTDFQGKIRRTLEHVCKVIGAPKPAAVTRKFAVDWTPGVSKIPDDVDAEEVTLEQTYLVRGKGEGTQGFIFVRRRGQNGAYTYSHSVRRDVGPEHTDDVCIIERQISGREYVALLKQADPTRRTIHKKVLCFVHDNHYFELQTYQNPEAGSLTVLQTESEDADRPVSLPSWLKVHKEVTTDQRYSSYLISLLDGTIPQQ